MGGRSREKHRVKTGGAGTKKTKGIPEDGDYPNQRKSGTTRVRGKRIGGEKKRPDFGKNCMRG